MINNINNKYLILLLIFVLIILIILNKINIVIFLLLLISFIYVIKNYLKDANNQNDLLMEKMYCRKSDIHNPMGNVLIYTNEDDLDYKLCKNKNIDAEIDSNLRFNIYNNRKDLFLKKNNVRTFITQPSTIYPNDIDNFKNNIYYFNDASCKLNGTNCIYNEYIKYHKNYFLSDKIKADA